MKASIILSALFISIFSISGFSNVKDIDLKMEVRELSYDGPSWNSIVGSVEGTSGQSVNTVIFQTQQRPGCFEMAKVAYITKKDSMLHVYGMVLNFTENTYIMSEKFPLTCVVVEKKRL